MKELIKKEIKIINNKLDWLTIIFGMEINEFGAYGFKYDTEDGRHFYFMDNWADILAVAHIDTVQQEPTLRYDKKNNMLYSSILDDRLGVYILAEHLLRDMKYDILLTIDEEQGRSTARSFNLKKNYKWIFSFDRKGTDVVMYNYENPDMVKLMGKYGFNTGMGSYSDICELEHLGCKGFNFGTGYYNAHSVDGYANLLETAENIAKFRKFYEDFKDVKFPHKGKNIRKHGSATSDLVTIEFED